MILRFLSADGPHDSTVTLTPKQVYLKVYFKPMIDFTGVSRPFMHRISEAEKRAQASCRQSQERLLATLTRRAVRTMWGEKHGFDRIRTAAGFARLPLTTYADMRPLIERMLAGERDVLWPGVCRRFAQSSGTSDGKSKYVPVTDDALQGNHYAGAAYSLASYLEAYGDSHVFGGKNFILGGSYANELTGLPRGVRVGDLSATLIDRINPLVNLFRIPSKKVALMADWYEKLPRLVEASAKADVRSISGVPSWFLTVLKGVLDATGAASIHDVWPNLEVFFHGGIAFGPYRAQYDRITDPARMRYWENYNASEGFFGVQQRPGHPAMELLMNTETYYELIPESEWTEATPQAIPVWEAREGEIYELVVTSSNGLWRYRLGDTVRVESTEPLTVTIAGRTRHFINAFGEEVMVYNTDAALVSACRATGTEVLNYTVAPVYAGDRTRGRHQWLVEFGRQPADIGQFADILDRALQAENSDYQAKRSGDIFLSRLEITEAAPGLFDRWLATTGKLGGQRKVPRLSNDRSFIDPMLALNTASRSQNVTDHKSGS